MSFVHARAADTMCSCGFWSSPRTNSIDMSTSGACSVATDHENVAACEQLSSMLDSVEKARAAIRDARAVLRALYDGPISSPDVETFLAVEADDQDIVAHLATAERSLRAVRSIVRSHRHDLAHATLRENENMSREQEPLDHADR